MPIARKNLCLEPLQTFSLSSSLNVTRVYFTDRIEVGRALTVKPVEREISGNLDVHLLNNNDERPSSICGRLLSNAL